MITVISMLRGHNSTVKHYHIGTSHSGNGFMLYSNLQKIGCRVLGKKGKQCL